MLKDGSFYDPLGYHFDIDGLDEAGGSYDKEGYYMSPTHFEEELAYQNGDADNNYDDLYGEEDDDDLETQEYKLLERQALIAEHI